MKRSFLFAAAIIILIVMFLVLSYPSFIFLKPYAHSGGIANFPANRLCDCVGFDYKYDLPCCDQGTNYYCLGFLGDCKCLNYTASNRDILNPEYVECGALNS